MTPTQLFCLTVYAIGMAIGQTLFKMAAENAGLDHGVSQPAPLLTRLAYAVLDLRFIAAIALYMSISVLWIWVLSFTPLSRAFPFSALALVFTVIIAVALFKESVSRTYLVGLILIISGLLLVSRG